LALLAGVLETLWTQEERSWLASTSGQRTYDYDDTREWAARVHEDIVDAIEAGDEQRAKSLLIEHLIETQVHVLSNPGPSRAVVAKNFG
jgi:DNA-binding GntR family transcriptional regulator